MLQPHGQGDVDVNSFLTESRPDLRHLTCESILMSTAMLYNLPEVLTFLMESHADPCSECLSSGATALHYACAGGHPANIDAIMALRPDAADVTDQLGNPPWMG